MNTVRKLAVICPTRGRPDGAAELIRAFRRTSLLWTTWSDRLRLVFVLDDDDPELGRYSTVHNCGDRDRWLVEVGVRRRLGPTLNEVGLRWARSGWDIGFMGDDHRPRTSGWDTEVIAALDSGCSVVYGDDLFQGEALPTAVFLDSAVVRALGFVVPPGMIHLYLDDWWLAFGKALGEGGLRYLEKVVIEHMHPVAGKGVWDERYAEVNSSDMYDADLAVWSAFQASGAFNLAVERACAISLRPSPLVRSGD